MNLTELNNYLNPLTKQYEGYTQTIKILDAKLNDYRIELAALKNKYDVTAIEKEISKANQLKNKTEIKIMSIKYRYVANLIYENLCRSGFDRQKKDKEFFQWLFKTFQIVYAQEYNFIDYETFYVDYIQENKEVDEVLDLEFDNYGKSLRVEAEYYFRSELDDRVRLIIPITVLEKYEVFEASVNAYFEDLKNKAEEEAKRQAIELEKKEYERYLELQKKYGGK